MPACPYCSSSDLTRDGYIDLTVYGGVAEEGNPGYPNIRVHVEVGSDADAGALQALHEHVLHTSPILSSVVRPVNVTSDLRVTRPDR
jgi:hypothetical protein